MKTLLIIIGVILVILLIYFFGYSNKYNSSTNTTTPTTSETQTSSTNTISIANMAFSPATLTVSAGDSITWTNNDSVTHTVTFDNGLDSGNIDPSQTWTHTFSDAGALSYYCSIHPSMTAQIIVR